MSENDKKIITILENALEEGAWVQLFQIARWLEKRAVFEKAVYEVLLTPPTTPS